MISSYDEGAMQQSGRSTFVLEAVLKGRSMGPYGCLKGVCIGSCHSHLKFLSLLLSKASEKISHIAVSVSAKESSHADNDCL